MKKTNKGITLIALIVTIIVLIILAGVAIAMLRGDNGTTTKATEAKSKNSYATAQEKILLAYNGVQTEISTQSAYDSSYDATTNENFLKLVNIVRKSLGMTEISNLSDNAIYENWTVMPTELANQQRTMMISYKDVDIQENNGIIERTIIVEGQNSKLATVLEPGLYDENDNLICAWANSGIDVEKNYANSNYRTTETSAYYVITKTYSNTKKIVLPTEVTNIGSYAFNGCTGLTSVTIPSSLTSIDSYAFYGCKGLTSVTIPSSVTSIGTYAFYDCTGLTSVTIPSSVTSIGSDAFHSCYGLTYIEIPSSVTSIGSNAFHSCYGLTYIEIPSSVTSIGTGVFYKCTGLTSITIPSSVTSIGSSAFDSCYGLTYIEIPSSVTIIEDYCFYDDDKLNTIKYNDVDYTSKSAFINAFNVNNGTIGEDVFEGTALAE